VESTLRHVAEAHSLSGWSLPKTILKNTLSSRTVYLRHYGLSKFINIHIVPVNSPISCNVNINIKSQQLNTYALHIEILARMHCNHCFPKVSCYPVSPFSHNARLNNFSNSASNFSSTIPTKHSHGWARLGNLGHVGSLDLQ